MNSLESLAPTGRWKVVGLIANRELTIRLRSKAFRISTLLTVIILVGLSLVAALVGGKGGTRFTVGVTQSTAVLAEPLKASGKSIDQTITTPQVSDEATGRAQVDSGKLDALLIGDGTTVHVVVKRDLDPKLANTLHVLAGQIAFRGQIEALGGDPSKVTAAVANAQVAVDPLSPPHSYNTQQLVLGIIAGILIYMSLMLNGQAVAQGVVEEKSSRVVELLLSTVRPWQLMSGKVAGIGLVGLIQMVIIGGAGVIAGVATGALHISVSAATGTVVWLVVWFLLGFLSYALAFAAVGALVSRQEDVAGVVTPVLMFVVIGYVLGISILPSDPGNGLMAVLSMVPMFAPTMMPMRLAMGGVPAWQAAVSVAGVVVLIPVLVWLAGRIYRNAVTRAGARIRLREAWRAT